MLRSNGQPGAARTAAQLGLEIGETRANKVNPEQVNGIGGQEGSSFEAQIENNKWTLLPERIELMEKFITVKAKKVSSVVFGARLFVSSGGAFFEFVSIAWGSQLGGRLASI